MIRTGCYWKRSSQGIPRESGDDPDTLWGYFLLAWYSPRERG